MCHSNMFPPDTAREKRKEEDGLEGKWDVSKVKGKRKSEITANGFGNWRKNGGKEKEMKFFAS